MSADNDIVSPGGLRKKCLEADRPAGGAYQRPVTTRGLLDETLVIWGGEFGRTPLNEAGKIKVSWPRDYYPRAFSLWMAGGGIKAGFTLGATDESGWNVTEDLVVCARLAGDDFELSWPGSHQADISSSRAGLRLMWQGR